MKIYSWTCKIQYKQKCAKWLLKKMNTIKKKELNTPKYINLNIGLCNQNINKLRRSLYHQRYIQSTWNFYKRRKKVKIQILKRSALI